MEDVESDSKPKSELKEDVKSNSPNTSQISLIKQPHSAPLQLLLPSCSSIQETISESEYIIIPEAKRVPSDNRIDVQESEES